MKVAVIGATGMVGTVMLKVLAERNFPVTEIIPVASEKSIGKQLQFKGKDYVVVGLQTAVDLKADVAIFSAAVADFKIQEQKDQKIKKNDFLNLNLKKNIDILNYVSNHNSLRPKLVIGFAAETSNIRDNAKKKLMEKNCDWIIANDVSNKSIGFESDFNEVTIFYKDNKINSEKLSMKKKSEISDEIVERAINQLN